MIERIAKLREQMNSAKRTRSTPRSSPRSTRSSRPSRPSTSAPSARCRNSTNLAPDRRPRHRVEREKVARQRRPSDQPHAEIRDRLDELLRERDAAAKPCPPRPSLFENRCLRTDSIDDVMASSKSTTGGDGDALRLLPGCCRWRRSTPAPRRPRHLHLLRVHPLHRGHHARGRHPHQPQVSGPPRPDTARSPAIIPAQRGQQHIPDIPLTPRLPGRVGRQSPHDRRFDAPSRIPSPRVRCASARAAASAARRALSTSSPIASAERV